MTSRHDSPHRRMYRRYVPVHQRMRNIPAYMQKRAGPVPDTLFVCFVPFLLHVQLSASAKNSLPGSPTGNYFLVSRHCSVVYAAGHTPIPWFLALDMPSLPRSRISREQDGQVSRGDGGVSRHGSGGQDCRTTGTAQPCYCTYRDFRQKLLLWDGRLCERHRCHGKGGAFSRDLLVGKKSGQG
jgi:hypothetical protein